MNNKKGFSLIEVLIVLTIITLISTVVIFNVSKTTNKQKEKNWQNTINRITSASMIYAENNPLVKDEVYKSNGFALVDVHSLINQGLLDEKELIDARNNELILNKEDEKYHSVKILLNENYAMEYFYPSIENNYIFVEPREVNLLVNANVNLIDEKEIKICIKDSCTSAYNKKIVLTINNNIINNPTSYKFTSVGTYTIQYQYKAIVDGETQLLLTSRKYIVNNNNCNLILNNNKNITALRNINVKIQGTNIIKYKLEEKQDTGEINDYSNQLSTTGTNFNLSENDGKKTVKLTCYYENASPIVVGKTITLDTAGPKCSIAKNGSKATVTVTQTSAGVGFRERKTTTTYDMSANTTRKYSNTKYGFNDLTGDYTLINPIINGRYSKLASTLKNYYTCKNVNTTTCNEMYQIISYKSGNSANVYKYISSSPYYWSRRYNTTSSTNLGSNSYIFGSGYTVNEDGYFVITGDIKTDKYITIKNEVNNYYTCLNKANCTTMYQIVSYRSGNSANTYRYTALNTSRDKTISLSSGTYVYTAYIVDKLGPI